MKHLKKALLLLPMALSGQAYASCSNFHGQVECFGSAAADTPGGTVTVTALNDFSTAMAVAVEPSVDETTATTATTGTSAASAGVGVECSWFNGDNNNDTNVCTLPLSYSIHNEIDPRRQLVIKVPITRVESKGVTPNTVYHVGLGASYTYPLATRWYVTPAINYTYAEEANVFGTKPKADLVSASIASAYYFKDQGLDIGIGNMFLASQSVNESGGQGSTHINVLRNGLMVGWPGKAFGRKQYWEASLVDTLFFGTTTYTDHQLEIGLTVGDKRSYKATGGGYRLGLSVFDAGQATGAKIAFGYWF